MSAGEGEYRHVLVAYDRSSHAHEALVYYVKTLFNEASDRISLVTVAKKDSDEEAARMALAQGRATLVELGVGEESIEDDVLATGAVAEAVVEAAEARACDLLVVGARGRGKVARFFLGSVSTYVVYHASAPVLVVKSGVVARLREEHPEWGPKVAESTSILCCLDGSAAADAAFNAALVAARGREVILFTVVEPMREVPGDSGEEGSSEVREVLLSIHQRKLDAAEALLKQYEERARDITDSVKAYVAVGDARDMVTRTVDAAATDIITLGASGKTGENVPLTIGSVATHVLHAVNVSAVLICQPTRQE
ncbi:uncharacterized protein AMSG_03107 [Thecamonas trahens ATCC 50062]|uniref:UspA domain-containing protein n=1 Tax=Thecamonas trahens ATCC 50062 TaxID=461836 RepID=A0A0L0D3C4_THETB|nr:hypothetical protein AMSG_03107 [Thecamonas trahens ATCC 50062]KNC46671.1 hypothetical protein AMSG_03107 [Thecamonas trahens ATCC 50062]|eukprot:XP_013760441.1 hypothetical protein AMSG_03107 [Thecamonas trahens ATCC 50062]